MTEKTKPLINRADVLRMAKEAGFRTRGELIRTMHSSGAWVGINEELERFAALVAALVAAHEREKCAKVCDAEAARSLFNWHNDTHGNQDFWTGAEQVVSGCAEAIRARGAA